MTQIRSWNSLSYDVVVVGAGHAGVEACLASARMGLKTLVITQSVDTIARMSCNPSIGGIAKGNIVREIDALGGEMARLTDKTLIQFRMLNASKGPAVRAPRAQVDKMLYATEARHVMESTQNLHILMDTVVEVTAQNASIGARDCHEPLRGSRNDGGEYDGGSRNDAGGRLAVTGVVTERGRVISARSVVLTTGTFLGGKIFIGEWDAPCGRLGEMAAAGLTKSLNKLGIKTGRLKTGTPPRVLKSTIDFDRLSIQEGDKAAEPFSFSNETVTRPLVPCHIAYTNKETHDIIRKNISRSPLYSGKITGTGPRYCPSIEDKVMRFADRDKHQIFVEPEGLSTDEIYLNGLSSSLPEEVQIAFMHTMAGFENAVQSRPGYAVEYDYADPTQLFPSLETKRAAGLFFAGQINGTSGYEEAAGQGIVAGINAAYCARAKGGEWQPLILRRDEAYIGVLIDDLVTLGTKEPYRMFTARAEYRLRLMYTTADRRLTRYAVQAGLKSKEAGEAVEEKYARQDALVSAILNGSMRPDGGFDAPAGRAREWEEAKIAAKYHWYIERQDAKVEKMHRMEGLCIPKGFDYDDIVSLSAESRAKLKKVRPVTLGQAARISGVRVSDVMLLLAYLK